MEYARRAGAPRSAFRREWRDFRGVDFSAAPEQTDARHSPDAVNVMVNDGGELTKRPGFRALASYGKRIWGIHRFAADGRTMLVVHAGSQLWLHGASPRLLYSGVYGGRSSSVVCMGKLWILTGREYLVFDGETVRRVSEIAYVPTVRIACDPATGAGTAAESVNLLSDRRRITFVADGTTETYLVDPARYDGVVSVAVNGTAADYSEDPGRRTISFPAPPAAPAVPGQANVEVVYAKRVPGYAASIERCRRMGLFGIGGADSDRVFFTGNPSKRNVDWHCEISAPEYTVDPSYVPDDSFARIGADGCAVVGYRRLGRYQIVLKEQDDQDASLFLRSGGVDGEGRAVFALTQGASGIGAGAPGSLANIGDEPVFLSRSNGVCGVASNELTQVTTVQNRSWFVDRLLQAEADRQEAVGVEWRGRYLLCLNGHAYVLDSRQSRSYREHSGSGYLYECFYWEGIPAVCLCEADGDLYFGSKKGVLYRFNTDLADDCAVYRDIEADGSAAPIPAYWTTGDDDDGFLGRYKKSLPRQCAMLLRTSGAASGVRLEISTDGGGWVPAAEKIPRGAFDFSAVDFRAFRFETCRPARYAAADKKPGRYVTMRFRVSNDRLGEDLPVAGIAREFTVGKKEKG